METILKTVVEGLAFGEGPRWHDGVLWWSDMHDHAVRRLAPSGEVQTICQVDGRPSGLGWLPGGDLLVVSMIDRRVLRLGADGILKVHADLTAVAPRRTNDMVVDRQGRAYVGNFGFDYDTDEPVTGTVLALVQPDGAVSVVANDLVFPNGMVITPDDRTLIVAETWGVRLTAFDIRPDGSLENRRLWAQLPDGVFPDGICLDAEGAVWVASPTANGCFRVLEGGQVTERIDTGRGAFACMLGGSDRRTLYICTADSSDHDPLRRNRTARIEAVPLQTPGAGLP
jgi:sugar lactone lactonase YvrE